MYLGDFTVNSLPINRQCCNCCTANSTATSASSYTANPLLCNSVVLPQNNAKPLLVHQIMANYIGQLRLSAAKPLPKMLNIICQYTSYIPTFFWQYLLGITAALPHLWPSFSSGDRVYLLFWQWNPQTSSWGWYNVVEVVVNYIINRSTQTQKTSSKDLPFH